jgi:hypothetical protein
MGVELFHADGQTDMMKPMAAFRNYGDAPKNCCLKMHLLYETSFVYM